MQVRTLSVLIKPHNDSLPIFSNYGYFEMASISYKQIKFAHLGDSIRGFYTIDCGLLTITLADGDYPLVQEIALDSKETDQVSTNEILQESLIELFELDELMRNHGKSQKIIKKIQKELESFSDGLITKDDLNILKQKIYFQNNLSQEEKTFLYHASDEQFKQIKTYESVLIESHFRNHKKPFSPKLYEQFCYFMDQL